MNWKDIRDRHQAIKWAEENGATIQTKGKKVEISTEKGVIKTSDDSRTMGKYEREQFRFWFWCLGLPIPLIVIVLVLFLFGQ